ncbi:MAG: hydrogenase iron-sulfur subunit [Candidatus Hydrogenedentes bacterium]|nr:hydrogenase iron-sulfur subunit [Candidatus Hydrogenedentota bacterium]
MSIAAKKDDAPHILVFSTNNISDPGIDMAGSAHMHYSTQVQVISVPCSSGIKPTWVLHALESGFDGVFIAADGTDCAYLPDCTTRTGVLVKKTQDLLKEHGRSPKRLRMAAVCSVCSESFVSHMANFQKDIVKIASD